MSVAAVRPRYPIIAPYAYPFTHRISPFPIPPVGALTPSRVRLDLSVPPYLDGENVTAAVIGAFDAPRLKEDIALFDRTFSLPDADLTVVSLAKQRHTVSSWATELSADAAWLHAMAPKAKLIAVIAADAKLTSLTEAIRHAAASGASVISLSFGMAEFEGQTAFDGLLEKTGALLVASAGNIGGQVYYPASSPYVLAVGGCRTYRDGAGNVLRRTASESGGGISAYESCPAWQYGLTGADTHRMVPDVALDADGTPGYAVFSLYAGGRLSCGGTSVASPIMAGICAGLLSLTPTVPPRRLIPFLYGLAAADRYSFDDITLGTSGDHRAHAGYDVCTGLGCPNVRLIAEAWEKADRDGFVEK